MQDSPPDFWHNLKSELAAGRRWVDRAVVLGYAALTGLVVVGFTLLTDAAEAAYVALGGRFGAAGPLLMLLWTPLLTVAVLAWTRRLVPEAGGAGIAQVVAALGDATPPEQRDRLVSLRLALHKIVLTAGALLAGLSVGREGPTVQVGAGVMLHARRWLSPRSGVDGHDLMVAGAAAGIAAAFNTPLGGVVFALEQLSARRNASHGGWVIASIVLAGLIAVSVFGNLSYFGVLKVQQLSWSLFGPGLLVALTSGLAGGLFARLLVASARGLPDRFSRWRRTHPLAFAAGCGFVVALIGLVTAGATAGAGYAPTRALLEGTAALPPLYTLLKLVATWLSAWSGVPGGMFAPSLAIGAGIGNDIAQLTAHPDASALIALGMVGFLAATTQGPITAFIIVMEMVAGHSMVLSLMATALLASGISRLISRPLYAELAAPFVAPHGTPGPAAEGAAPR